MATARLLYVQLLMIGLNLAAFEANPVHQNDCILDESAVTESSRTCKNKQCSLDTDVCNGNRQCVCDGACGYRCINIRNPKLCQELPVPVHGSVVYTTNRAHGAKATYKCSPGYGLVNAIERTCLGDGEWNVDATPTCLPNGEICPRLVNGSECLPACTRQKDCPKKTQQICVCRDACGMSCVDVFVPGYCQDIELTEGTIILSVTPSGSMYTSVATIGCDDGYEMDTETQEISCEITGQWSAQPARCTVRAICNPPPRVEHARYNSRSRTFSPGDILSYTCSPGYHDYGNGEISTCLTDLSWTPVVMKCYAVSCGDPGYPRNGWRDGDLFTYLSRVVYHCNEGYEMRGYAFRSCLSDRRWSSIMPSCEAIQCPPLFAPDHGTVQGTQYEFDEQVYFACKDGYRLEGSAVRRCQGDKTWSGDEVTCRVVRCPEPETPEHGSKVAPRLGLNAFVRFFCNNGYSLVGSQTARCTMAETWSNPAPQCKADCIVLNAPQNGAYKRSYTYTIDPGQTVAHGTVIQIDCDLWYSLNSNEQYMCNDGQWSFYAKCDAAPCSRLEDLANGEISYEPEVNKSLLMIPHNTRASYSCLYGFEHQGEESVTVTCSYSIWSSETPPVCQPKPCVEESLWHGKVVYDPSGDPHHGTTRTFECSEGYSLASTVLGDQSCNNGKWTSPLPSCQPNPCAEFRILSGTIRNPPRSLDHGQTVHFTCNTGLKPSAGDGQAHCHAGHWVPNDLKCIPNGASYNIAYGKPAVQSGTFGAITGNASLAVDGDRSSDFDHGSCTDARRDENVLFWQVDLQDVYKIESVDIYKRQDCCEKRLSEASIHVGLTDGETSRQCGPQMINKQTVASQQPIHVDCAADNLYGQYLTIRLPSNRGNKMQLCEVEVLGSGPVKTCSLHNAPNLKVSLSMDEDIRVDARVAASVWVYYSCIEGYSLYGSPINQCEQSGVWAYATPRCEPDGCDVNNPDHGQLNQPISRVKHGRSIAYSCNSNYTKLHKEVVCEIDHFEPGPPSCVPERCHLDASQLTNVLINNQEPSLDAPVTIDHNDQVTFSCQTGFHDQTNSNTQTHCSFGKLQDPIPTCIAVRCLQPPSIEHGSYSIIAGDASLKHKTILHYQCDQGYSSQTGDTDTYLRCNSNGNWNGDLLACQLETLDEPAHEFQACTRPSVQRALIYHRNQNIANSGFEIIFGDGDIITIRCNSGFRVNGQASATCRNGNWEPSLPSCEVSYSHSCQRPKRKQDIAQYVNGLDKIENIDPSIMTFTHGATIISRCRDPLVNKLVTSAERTCHDGRWAGEEPRCEPTQERFLLQYRERMLYQYYANGTLLIYPRIGQLIIGCVVSSPFLSSLVAPHREHLIFKSEFGKNYGAPREEHSGVYKCQRLGQPEYNNSLDIQVRAVSCPEPAPLLNGRRIGNDFKITKSVLFECNDGFQLVGDSIFKCNLGRWSPSFFPFCRSLNCSEIRSDDPQIIVRSGGTSVGSIVAFACRLGYRLVGDDDLECQPGGTWSNSIPYCEEKVDLTTTEQAVLDCGGDCEIWERCIRTDHGQWRCSCINPRQCEEEEDGSYCGTDGNNYTSICQLKAAGCLLEKDIEVDYQGPCRQEFNEATIAGLFAEDSSFSDSEGLFRGK